MKEQERIPTQTEIMEMMSKITNLQNRALFIFGYLTAGRTNEIVKSVRKSDIKFLERNGRRIMLIDMPNLKNRTRHFKDLPIPIDREGAFVAMLEEYMNMLPADALLFPFSDRTARNIIRRLTGLNLRYIRHIRLTHLVSLYDFNEQLLVRYAGWTDSRPAKHYMELRWPDFLSKM